MNITSDYESLKHALTRSKRARSRWTRFAFSMDGKFFSYRVETLPLAQKTIEFINDMRETFNLSEEALVETQAKSIVDLYTEDGRHKALAIPAYALATMNEELQALPPFVGVVWVAGMKGVSVITSDMAADFFEEFEKAQQSAKPKLSAMLPCPKCRVDWGQTLVTRGNTIAVQCTVCEYRGQEVRVPTIAEWGTWPNTDDERKQEGGLAVEPPSMNRYILGGGTQWDAVPESTLLHDFRTFMLNFYATGPRALIAWLNGVDHAYGYDFIKKRFDSDEHLTHFVRYNLYLPNDDDAFAFRLRFNRAPWTGDPWCEPYVGYAVLRVG